MESSQPAKKLSNSPLLRRLGVRDATAIVVGTVIGTGVFLKTAVMSQNAGSPLFVLAAWLVAGVLSLLGALTYAELGTLMPAAGGEYVYLREAYGALVGYLYGWTRFWIGSPGSIAAYAVGAATFFSGLCPMASHRSLMAVGFISLFTIVNCFSVGFGGRVQSILTLFKIAMILTMTAAIFFFASTGDWHHLVDASAGGWKGWTGFGTAVIAALWAYDGWNNLPMAAGEVREPSRVLPIALGVGMAVVFAIYATANLAYFYALPFHDVINANSSAYPNALPVATKAAAMALGTGAISLLSFAFVISALGAMNGSILTGARVPFAMAQDKLFFSALARVHPSTHVPVIAVVVQGVWACGLALSGTFDQLTDYVVISSWIFYALNMVAVFRFRKRGERSDVYRTPFYPWPPIVFLICATLLFLNVLLTQPRESLYGIGIIAAGLPFYFYFARNQLLNRRDSR